MRRRVAVYDRRRVPIVLLQGKHLELRTNCYAYNANRSEKRSNRYAQEAIRP